MKPEDYTKLPEPVKLADTVAEVDARRVGEPESPFISKDMELIVKYGL